MESSRVSVTSRVDPEMELEPSRSPAGQDDASHDNANKTSHDGSEIVNHGHNNTFINYKLDSSVISGSKTSMARAFEAAQRARSLANIEAAQRSRSLKAAQRIRSGQPKWIKARAIRTYQRLKALESERAERERTIALERAERERSRAMEIARWSTLRALRVGLSDEEEWFNSICVNITSVSVNGHGNVTRTVTRL